MVARSRIRPHHRRRPLDGHSTDLERVRFTVCPWWDGPLTRQGVDEQLAADAIDRPERWVWVYHSPPAERTRLGVEERCSSVVGAGEPG